MADSTLAALTAATLATGGLFYGTQGGADRKFTLTAAGASLMEAATAADQRTAMGAAAATALDGKLNLTGGTLTGALTFPDGSASSPSFKTSSSGANNIGIFGSSASLVFTAYGSAQMAFATSWNGSGLGLQTNFTLDWTASNLPTTSPDLIVGRGGAAATLQLGRNHATTPTNQCLKAHNVTTGTGARLELAGGTGSTGRGHVILNGGNRASNFSAPGNPSLSGGDTVNLGELSTFCTSVADCLANMRTTLISHGLVTPDP